MNRGSVMRKENKAALKALVCAAAALAMGACSDTANPTTSVPAFPRAEQSALDSLRGACSDEHHSDADLDAKARVILESIQEKTPLGTNEDRAEVLRFLRNSIPASAEPMDCSGILTIYAVQRMNGYITPP